MTIQNQTTNVSSNRKSISQDYLTWSQSINEKYVEIFCPINPSNNLSVVLYHCYDQEGLKLWQECIKIDCSNYILIAVSHLDFQNDMTPWPAKGLSKRDSDFRGEADNYINILKESILPLCQNQIESTWGIKIVKWCIAGYSLSGLFSLYLSTKLEQITNVASVSGSLWYPCIVDYIKSNTMNPLLERMYFSLGNKEKASRNQTFRCVEENTKDIELFYHEKGIITIFEENEGNHFNNALNRTARGIKWLVE